MVEVEMIVEDFLTYFPSNNFLFLSLFSPLYFLLLIFLNISEEFHKGEGVFRISEESL